MISGTLNSQRKPRSKKKKTVSEFEAETVSILAYGKIESVFQFNQVLTVNEITNITGLRGNSLDHQLNSMLRKNLIRQVPGFPMRFERTD